MELLCIGLEVFLLLVAAIVGIAYWQSPRPTESTFFIRPSGSKKYQSPEGWHGLPVDSKQRFVNEEYSFYQDYVKIIAWLLLGHLACVWRNRNQRFPVDHHTSPEILKVDETLIWLGHASFFLRINNISILIDPQFYHTSLYRRHTDNPIPENLFTSIDYILLSHDHQDHCDKKSMRLLIKNNPAVKILGGLNMGGLIKSFVKKGTNFIPAEWYEAFPINEDFEIYFVPSRHYSKRLFQKFNSRLWGGFVLRYKTSLGNTRTIYYGGDSGYGSHFRQIKKLFKPDIAILPIGSFEPTWLMEANHMSPDKAVKAFRDCGANKMIPMHFGTFNLSNEPMDLPHARLLEILPGDELIKLKAGEQLSIS